MNSALPGWLRAVLLLAVTIVTALPLSCADNPRDWFMGRAGISDFLKAFVANPSSVVDSYVMLHKQHMHEYQDEASLTETKRKLMQGITLQAEYGLKGHAVTDGKAITALANDPTLDAVFRGEMHLLAYLCLGGVEDGIRAVELVPDSITLFKSCLDPKYVRIVKGVLADAYLDAMRSDDPSKPAMRLSPLGIGPIYPDIIAAASIQNAYRDLHHILVRQYFFLTKGLGVAEVAQTFKGISKEDFREFMILACQQDSDLNITRGLIRGKVLSTGEMLDIINSQAEQWKKKIMAEGDGK